MVVHSHPAQYLKGIFTNSVFDMKSMPLTVSHSRHCRLEIFHHFSIYFPYKFIQKCSNSRNWSLEYYKKSNSFNCNIRSWLIRLKFR